MVFGSTHAYFIRYLSEQFYKDFRLIFHGPFAMLLTLHDQTAEALAIRHRPATVFASLVEKHSSMDLHEGAAWASFSLQLHLLPVVRSHLPQPSHIEE
jgi:hypothetical protein